MKKLYSEAGRRGPFHYCPRIDAVGDVDSEPHHEWFVCNLGVDLARRQWESSQLCFPIHTKSSYWKISRYRRWDQCERNRYIDHRCRVGCISIFLGGGTFGKWITEFGFCKYSGNPAAQRRTGVTLIFVTQSGVEAFTRLPLEYHNRTVMFDTATFLKQLCQCFSTSHVFQPFNARSSNEDVGRSCARLVR